MVAFSNEFQVRPVAFLDFDDVLAVNRIHSSQAVLAVFNGDIKLDTPELWSSIFHVQARDNLRTLHAEFSPQYVVSSSWVLEMTREQIQEVLTRTDLQFINENMHNFWCTPRSEGSYRLSEIEDWLNEHAPLSEIPYVVIDDVLSGQSIPGSDLEHRTVLCDARSGFTYQNLLAAQKILRSQIQ